MLKQALQKFSAMFMQHDHSDMQGMHFWIPEAESDFMQATYFEKIASEHHHDYLTHQNTDSPPTEYRNAMWNFLTAALKGHKEAQYRLGMGYLNGELGLDRNYEHAQLWLQKSAAQGYAPANSALGHAYEEIAF